MSSQKDTTVVSPVFIHSVGGGDWRRQSKHHETICTRCIGIGSSYKLVYTTTIWRLQFRLTSTLFHHKVIAHNKVTSFCNNEQQPKFGIVAALSKDGIIGANGRLPWKSIPQDLNHFINLTRNKILIVGRKTFADEDPTGGHVKHVRVCIVVSKTMSATDLSKSSTSDKVICRPEIMIAHSFDEALDVASTKILQSSDEESVNGSSSNDIDIWVAGGERIYKEALQHDNAVDVHLTHIDMSVEKCQDLLMVYVRFACIEDHLSLPNDYINRVLYLSNRQQLYLHLV